MCACACVACAQACARDTMHRVGMRAGYSAEGPLRVRVPAGGGRTARESAARRLYASSPEIFSSGFGKADLVHAMTSGGVPGAHAITSGRTCDGWRDWRRAQTLLGSAKAWRQQHAAVPDGTDGTTKYSRGAASARDGRTGRSGDVRAMPDRARAGWAQRARPPLPRGLVALALLAHALIFLLALPLLSEMSEVGR
jgi:hypothetical protein